MELFPIGRKFHRRWYASIPFSNSSQASDAYVAAQSMLSYVDTYQLQPRARKPAASAKRIQIKNYRFSAECTKAEEH